MPTLLMVLRKPFLRDSFNAALAIASALCIKADLGAHTRAQLAERAARHLASPGAESQAAAGFLALSAQVQDLEEVLPVRVLRGVEATGADILARALPRSLDCSHFLASLARSSLAAAVSTSGSEAKKTSLSAAEDDDEEGGVDDLLSRSELGGLASGLLTEASVADAYAAPLVLAALECFCQAGSAREQRRMAKALRKPLAEIGNSQPLVTSLAFKQAVDAALERGLNAEPLADLLAPSCAQVADEEGGVGGCGSLLPVFQAFSHKSIKVRREALKKAVEDMEHFASSEAAQLGDDEPVNRQRLLASLALQAAGDPSEPQVVSQALGSKVLWSDLPQAPPSMTVPCLEGLLGGLLAFAQPTGSSFQGLFTTVVAQDPRIVELLPAAVNSCAWVLAREDCSEEHKGRLDMLLLPLLILCAVGLDLTALPLAATGGGSGLGGGDAAAVTVVARELRAALLHYCGVSRHALLTRFDGGEPPQAPSKSASSAEVQLGHLAGAMGAALDAETAEGLCDLVEGLTWNGAANAGGPCVLLGGCAAQAAAATLLAGSLPQLLKAKQEDGIDRILDRGIEGCQRLAAHCSLTRESKDGSEATGGGTESLCHLVRALLGAISAVDARRREGGSASKVGKKRRNRASAAAEPLSSLQSVMANALRLMLDRPKMMAGELRTALACNGELLRPALLQVALGPAQLGRSSAGAVANALVLLRSLVASPVASSWAADQALVVPLLSCLNLAETCEVRAAALGVLEALRQTDWTGKDADRDSICAKALRAACVTCPGSDVLTTKGWEAASEKGLELVSLPKKSLDALLDRALAHKAEIVRDGNSVILVLSKLFTNKSCGLNSKSRIGLAAFVSVELAMLVRPAASVAGVPQQSPALLAAIPSESLLGGLIDPLRCSAQDMISALGRGDEETPTQTAPALLQVASLKALEVLRGDPMAFGKGEEGQKVQTASEEAVCEFLRDVALPVIDAMAEVYEGGGAVTSETTIELVSTICHAVACVAGDGKQGPTARAAAVAIGAKAACALLRLCTAAPDAAAPAANDNTVAAEDSNEIDAASLPPSKRVPVAARTAFGEACLAASNIQGLLSSLKSSSRTTADFARQHAGLELLQPHVVSLGSSSLAGAGELLLALADVAKESSTAQDGSDGDVTTRRSQVAESALAAVAALGEIVGGVEAGRSRDNDTSLEVDAVAVLDAVAEVCRAGSAESLGSRLLTLAFRICGALAPLLPPQPAPQKVGVVEALRAPRRALPMKTCLELLERFTGPLGLDALGLLKGALMRLRRFPEVTQGSAEAVVDFAMRRDLVTQSRLRSLLYAVVVAHPQLLPEVGLDACLSLAHSVGVYASLDFAVLLLLERREMDKSTQKNKRKKKRSLRKKRAMLNDGELDADEAVLLEAVDVAIEQDEVVDEALKLLSSVPMETRFHAFGTLSQTIASMAAELWKQRDEQEGHQKRLPGLGPVWGPGLLPSEMSTELGPARLRRLLEVALDVLIRFVTEHGIPSGLDEEMLDTSVYRATAGELGGAQSLSPGAVVATAICYAMKAACTVEVLLESAGDRSGSVALDRAKQLRGLLMRSLAVNHPVTLFRVACFALQLPDFSPPLKSLGVLGEDLGHRFAEASCVLSGTSEALTESRELRIEAGSADTDADEDLQKACAPHCASLMRYVCGDLLGGGGGTTAAEQPTGFQVVAWNFLESISLFSARATPKPVLEVCFPAISVSIKAVDSNDAKTLQAAIASCTCLHTAVEQLGRALLEKLGLVATTLLDLLDAGSNAASVERSPEAMLQQCALRAFQAVFKSVGAFMSPFLSRALMVVATPSQPWRTKLLEALCRAMVEGVPHRLLLPAVQMETASTVKRLADIGSNAEAGDTYASAATVLDAGLLETQRLAVCQMWIFAESTPAFVTTAGVDAALASALQLLVGGVFAVGAFLRLNGRPEDIPVKVFRRCIEDHRAPVVPAKVRWTDNCAEASASKLLALGASAVAQCSLRLGFDELKPQFVKILDWARNTQSQVLARQGSRKSGGSNATPWDGPEVPRDDAEDAARALVVVAVMRGLTDEAPDIAEELFLPLATKDLLACLVASRRQALHVAQDRGQIAKKRRRAGVAVSRRRNVDMLAESTWWWFDVSSQVMGFIAQALRQAGAGASTSRPVEEALDALTEPCIDVIDIMEFLPSEDECALTRSLLQSVQGALVTLATASDSTRMKRLLTHILEKTRSEDAEVRLSAVKACHKVWIDIGVQAVSGLSEVIMFAAELLEDEDPRVETAVRAMIKTMEDCTGESLQESLKR
eukprot:TRINITY_DN27436_c0_g2_i1.p1 TRINITY_DN27436_c0_g2~~TRINITY_DN27436_c0_g2_i1.p1  ORF type:complete len:2554 (+),score=544.28 TRINITY_DN27436_c0_g2_i1:787-7662(+)